MKTTFCLILFVIFSVEVNSQNYIQIGPSVNYGLTTLKSSKVGTGIDLDLKKQVNDIVSASIGTSVFLHGGKSNCLQSYEYGAWNVQLRAMFNINIINFENSTPLYILTGISYNYSKSIFINCSDKIDTQDNSIYPGIIAGIGSRLSWGINNAIVFELRFNQLMTYYYDFVKADSNRCDSYICFSIKTEFPL